MKSQNILYKLLIIFLFPIIVCCSKGDDFYDKKYPKEIVGKWMPIKRKTICPSTAEIIYDYSSCDQKNVIEFLKDGTYKELFYYSTKDGDCIQSFSKIGSWYVSKADVLTIYRPLGFGFYQDYQFWHVSSSVLKLGDSSLYSCDGDTGFIEYTKI